MDPTLLSKQLYQMARFQVLSTAINLPHQGRMSDDYIHAWYDEVYPYKEHDGLHIPFEEHFKVRKAAIESLAAYLDGNWQNGMLFTFYEIEEHFGVRESTIEWPRSKMISAMRYLFLNRLFDEAFWGKLLTDQRHPVEARPLTRSFDITEISC